MYGDLIVYLMPSPMQADLMMQLETLRVDAADNAEKKVHTVATPGYVHSYNGPFGPSSHRGSVPEGIVEGVIDGTVESVVGGRLEMWTECVSWV